MKLVRYVVKLYLYVLAGTLIGGLISLPFTGWIADIYLGIGALGGLLVGILRLRNNQDSKTNIQVSKPRQMTEQQKGLLVTIGAVFAGIILGLLKSSSQSTTKQRTNSSRSTSTQRYTKPSYKTPSTQSTRKTVSTTTKPTKRSCSTCSGKGKISKDTLVRCSKCNGKGGYEIGGVVTYKPAWDNSRDKSSWQACGKCRGKGKVRQVNSSTCPTCNGIGQI